MSEKENNPNVIAGFLVNSEEEAKYYDELLHGDIIEIIPLSKDSKYPCLMGIASLGKISEYEEVVKTLMIEKFGNSFQEEYKITKEEVETACDIVARDLCDGIKNGTPLVVYCQPNHND